jgi:hypothetical protein
MVEQAEKSTKLDQIHSLIAKSESFRKTSVKKMTLRLKKNWQRQ